LVRHRSGAYLWRIERGAAPHPNDPEIATMFRNTFFAAALSLAALTGVASAADLSGPYVVGSGENQEVVYPAGTQASLVGGGLIDEVQQLNGTSTRIYGANPAPQNSLIPHNVGSGENASVVYGPQG
jgi:hypothetical protein